VKKNIIDPKKTLKLNRAQSGDFSQNLLKVFQVILIKTKTNIHKIILFNKKICYIVDFKKAVFCLRFSEQLEMIGTVKFGARGYQGWTGRKIPVPF